MKSVASRLMKTATHLLTLGVFLLLSSSVIFAQPSTQDVLKDAAREGAKEMLMGKQEIEGRTEMMNGARLMMDGRKTLKEHLLNSGKLNKEEGLEGGKLLTEGYELVVNGDKLIAAEKIAQGKEKMVAGAKMMADAKKMMLHDLFQKGKITQGDRTKGEIMMNDGEKMMDQGKMMMLK